MATVETHYQLTATIRLTHEEARGLRELLGFLTNGAFEALSLGELRTALNEAGYDFEDIGSARGTVTAANGA